MRALLLLAACHGGPDDKAAADDSAHDTGDDTAPPDTGEPERWTGRAEVRVVDPDGLPVEGAFVMLGGWPTDRWVATDAEGRATIEVDDDGTTDRWLLAGMAGWQSGGEDVDEEDGVEGEVEITLTPLPEVDGTDYVFQPGGDAMSPDTSECGHCHMTIADGWAGSRHREAARNPATWDLYTGSAEADCDALGGFLAEGQSPGEEGVLAERCYVGEGVLPWLNEGCGEPGETPCDHPDARAALTRFGSCGDCHSPAVTGGVPGSIDLAANAGLAYDEGVACDFCHKVREVIPGGGPGIDGSVVLWRPSRESTVPGQQYDPITFGPYPDVVVPIMKGSYAPGFRESGWCAGCHEHRQQALHPDEALAERFADGLPVQETWSEYLATAFPENGVTCQLCHMGRIDEDSSTYDVDTMGVVPSVEDGWRRAYGEVRHHSFPAGEAMDPPGLDVALDLDGDEVVATVTVSNKSAGHAIPSGEPLRQLLLLVEARDDAGALLASTGGRTIPDVGGALAVGTVGVDLEVAGTALTFGEDLPEATGLVVRFVRPTGTWAEDEGPGTDSTTGLSPEERNLPIAAPLGEVEVSSVSGNTATLASAPPDLVSGDMAFVAAEGDWAGASGWVFAKVLLDAGGARGVAHYRAVDVASDNRIAPGGSVATEHRFAVGGDAVEVIATLVYRRYGDPVARAYGWDRGDREVASGSASISTAR